ncbi:MAG: hypothetical protein Q8L81_16435 [Bacteroidota bacterium]|nr:hypothetical protein [Bacteroidota bacterium]
MNKITSSTELREAILRLEIKQGEDERLLKEEFKSTYERMKPVNIIKNSIKEIVATTNIKENLLKVVISVATNYFLKSSLQNSTKSPVKMILQKILGAFSN